ncbi:MAG TPA: hypothetical protein VJK51_03115 [Candidatus Nanoarchaeia archaeon]|nr:hypothetical protein [Candidatus Nanoarchaeia archaeon]
MIRAQENLWGAWAFLVGVLLSILGGVVAGFSGATIGQIVIIVQIAIGIIAGYFVPEREIMTFLTASVSLVIVSYAGLTGLVQFAAIRGINIGVMVSSILGSLLFLFVTATIIVALKAVFSIAKS